eukprot:TRINITY_DN74114_c0_g1_i1.p1 TRINITY_DN74114_c0_g1~~TRINITY_DN74114_c0_g1_i1.p1  ORF type:complete len:416 (+),score=105.61 TRINITY_DN74114_c0_g1_i1:159-1406(+)
MAQTSSRQGDLSSGRVGDGLLNKLQQNQRERASSSARSAVSLPGESLSGSAHSLPPTPRAKPKAKATALNAAAAVGNLGRPANVTPRGTPSKLTPGVREKAAPLTPLAGRHSEGLPSAPEVWWLCPEKDCDFRIYKSEKGAGARRRYHQRLHAAVSTTTASSAAADEVTIVSSSSSSRGAAAEAVKPEPQEERHRRKASDSYDTQILRASTDFGRTLEKWLPKEEEKVEVTVPVAAPRRQASSKAPPRTKSSKASTPRAAPKRKASSAAKRSSAGKDAKASKAKQMRPKLARQKDFRSRGHMLRAIWDGRFRGTRAVSKEDLVINKRGKIVPKRKAAVGLQGYRQNGCELWMNCLTASRKAAELPPQDWMVVRPKKDGTYRQRALYERTKAEFSKLRKRKLEKEDEDTPGPSGVV